MPIWKTGQEFIELKELEGFELLKVVKKGFLQPIDPETGDPVSPPDIQAELNSLKKIREEFERLKIRYRVLSMSPEEKKSLIQKVEHKGPIAILGAAYVPKLAQGEYPGWPPKVPHLWPLVIAPPVLSLTRDEEGKKYGYSSTYPPSRAKI